MVLPSALRFISLFVQTAPTAKSAGDNAFVYKMYK